MSDNNDDDPKLNAKFLELLKAHPGRPELAKAGADALRYLISDEALEIAQERREAIMSILDAINNNNNDEEEEDE